MRITEHSRLGGKAPPDAALLGDFTEAHARARGHETAAVEMRGWRGQPFADDMVTCRTGTWTEDRRSGQPDQRGVQTVNRPPRIGV